MSLCELLKPFVLGNFQIQDSGSGLFANSQNVLITGGTFVVTVSLSYGYKQLIIIHILSARMSIFSPPVLEKGI